MITIDELIGVLEKYKEQGMSGDDLVKIVIKDKHNHLLIHEIMFHATYSDARTSFVFLQTSKD